MIYCGVDPDVRCLPFAYLDDAGRLMRLDVLEAKDADSMIGALVHYHPYYSGEEMCCAVEAQYFIVHTRAPPQDVALVGEIAGAAKLLLREVNYCSRIYSPQPSQWKGQLKKRIHHPRIAERMGWRIELRGSNPDTQYGVVVEPQSIAQMVRLPTMWKHALDSVGLALWARDESRI